MSREQQIEDDARQFRLDEYPGLDAVIEALEESEWSTNRADMRRMGRLIMNTLAGFGWRFKPAKKIRPKVKSLQEVYWDELDRLMELLMSDHETEVPREILAAEARGVAFAIAHIQDPYAPSVDAVRAEALERWETANAEAE